MFDASAAAPSCSSIYGIFKRVFFKKECSTIFTFGTPFAPDSDTDKREG